MIFAEILWASSCTRFQNKQTVDSRLVKIAAPEKAHTSYWLKNLVSCSLFYCIIRWYTQHLNINWCDLKSYYSILSRDFVIIQRNGLPVNRRGGIRSVCASQKCCQIIAGRRECQNAPGAAITAWSPRCGATRSSASTRIVRVPSVD